MAFKRKAGEDPDYEFLGYYDPRPSKSARHAHQRDVREQMNMSTSGHGMAYGVGAVTYAFSMRHKIETLENELRTAKSIARRTQAQSVEQEEHVSDLEKTCELLRSEKIQLEGQLERSELRRRTHLGMSQRRLVGSGAAELRSLKREFEETRQKLLAEEICHKSAVTQIYTQSDEIERQETVIKDLMKEKMQLTRELEGRPKEVARMERRLREKDEALKSIAGEARRLAAMAEGCAET